MQLLFIPIVAFPHSFSPSGNPNHILDNKFHLFFFQIWRSPFPPWCSVLFSKSIILKCLLLHSFRSPPFYYLVYGILILFFCCGLLRHENYFLVHFKNYGFILTEFFVRLLCSCGQGSASPESFDLFWPKVVSKGTRQTLMLLYNLGISGLTVAYIFKPRCHPE